MLYFVCSPRIQILVTGDPKWKPYFTTPAVQDSFFQPDMPQLEYHSAVGDDSLSQFFSHSYGPRRKWDFLIAYFEPHDLDTLNTNLENLVNRIDEETLLVALASWLLPLLGSWTSRSLLEDGSPSTLSSRAGPTVLSTSALRPITRTRLIPPSGYIVTLT